jgi:ubiquinone/menaquinone biosynthesis C-methylase UbiE
MSLRKWKEVYERLPLERQDKSLAEISGFDKSCTNYEAFRKAIFAELLKVSKIKKASSVCEVGCGCGDKLALFYDSGYRCFGVDYAQNMIKRAKQEMPSADLHVSEANMLPFADNSMDLVFSYSVFFYFENWQYTCKVLEQMYRVAKPDAVICIWDLPDVEKKDQIETLYRQAQAGYEHTYFNRNDFIQWFKLKKIKQVRADFKFLPFYRHSSFRFNVTAKLAKGA